MFSLNRLTYRVSTNYNKISLLPTKSWRTSNVRGTITYPKEKNILSMKIIKYHLLQPLPKN